MGKGEVILISTPLIMTNYGMLSGRGSEYIFRLLSRFGDKPVHRVRLNTLSKTREEDMLASFRASSAHSSRVMPATGMRGRTSVAPLRGWAP